eukprot:scaffold136958_cov178-Phaeocystis_antarctica.AAC.1
MTRGHSGGAGGMATKAGSQHENPTRGRRRRAGVPRISSPRRVPRDTPPARRGHTPPRRRA